MPLYRRVPKFTLTPKHSWATTHEGHPDKALKGICGSWPLGQLPHGHHRNVEKHVSAALNNLRHSGTTEEDTDGDGPTENDR